MSLADDHLDGPSMPISCLVVAAMKSDQSLIVLESSVCNLERDSADLE